MSSSSRSVTCANRNTDPFNAAVGYCGVADLVAWRSALSNSFTFRMPAPYFLSFKPFGLRAVSVSTSMNRSCTLFLLPATDSIVGLPW